MELIPTRLTRAVEHDQRPPAATGRTVDGIDCSALPGARFTLHEEIQVRLRDARQQREQLSHRAAMAAKSPKLVGPGGWYAKSFHSSKLDVGLADREHGLLGDHDLSNLDWAQPGAVRALEVAERYGLGAEDQLEVGLAGRLVFEHQMVRNSSSSPDSIPHERLRMTSIRSSRDSESNRADAIVQAVSIAPEHACRDEGIELCLLDGRLHFIRGMI